MKPTPPSTPARDRLKGIGARATPARLAVLDILLASPRALSHQEIEHAAHEHGQELDRVTLYRVLDWLVAQQLAHKITAEDRVGRFNAADREAHGHAHFHCTECGQVYCLNELQPVLAVTLPPGYRYQRAELTIQGRCPGCGP